MPKHLPKLCQHKPTGQAYVRCDGRMKYLGKYGSEDAQERYDALIATLKRDDEMLAYGITVGQLVRFYLEHAKGDYVKDGQPTSEVNNLRLACGPLVKRSRSLLAREFSPRKLKQVSASQQLPDCGIWFF